MSELKLNEGFSSSPLGVGGIYFIGIGGIGMSAIARYFHFKGINVSGYDKTATALTRELEASGIAVHYEENVDVIPKNVQLVVYTPAVPKDHKELLYYQQQGYKVVPMIVELAKKENRQNELKQNISALAITDADKKIAGEILKVI